MIKKQNKLEKNKIMYGLKSIRVNSFSIETPKQKVNENEPVLYDFNVIPEIKYNLAENLILVALQGTVKIKQTSEKVLEINVAFIFAAKDLNSFILQNEKGIWDFKDKKDEGLIITLLSISLSTLRGIIYEKTRGTIMDSVVMPVMDPSTFIKVD